MNNNDLANFDDEMPEAQDIIPDKTKKHMTLSIIVVIGIIIMLSVTSWVTNLMIERRSTNITEPIDQELQLRMLPEPVVEMEIMEMSDEYKTEQALLSSIELSKNGNFIIITPKYGNRFDIFTNKNDETIIRLVNRNN